MLGLSFTFADMGPLFEFKPPYFGVGFGLLLFFLFYFVGRPLARFFRDINPVAAARIAFRDRRLALQSQFFQTAAATGKPRGLRWKACDWDGVVEFAREKGTGRLAALVGVTIQFEAIEGGDMEGVAAVGNLRNASAVFFYDRGQWRTIGKAVFNLNPDEALTHFAAQYERLI